MARREKLRENKTKGFDTLLFINHFHIKIPINTSYVFMLCGILRYCMIT